MKLKGLVYFFILLLIVKLVFSVRINEVMYNPSGSDSDHEWIEIYNNGSDIDIRGWKFFENNQNHGLTLKQGNWTIKNNSYAIIAEDWDTFLLDYPNFNVTLFDSSFDLKNSEGEFIAIKNGTTYFISNLTYNISIGANGDGNSLQLVNETWYALTPTPGTENIFIFNETQENGTNITGKDLEITVNLNGVLDLFVEYNSLFKITNKDHESGITDYINVTVFYNISKKTLIKEDFFNIIDLNSYKTSQTGNIIFNETGNYTICGQIINTTETNYNKNNDFVCKNVLIIDTRKILCNVSISISTDNLIYNNSESIKFYNLLNNESFLYKIEYWIEDLFNNLVKNKINTSNTNQKSWTPNIDESVQVFLIKNRIVELYCNDTYLDDNSAEKLIIVKGEKKKESNISIDKIYLGSDNKAKFGESIRIRVNIYKGEETKNNVKLWFEDAGNKISKTTSTNLYTEFTNYDMTLAVQLDPNCNERKPNGMYKLYVSGFDLNDSRDVLIEGVKSSNCEKIRVSSSGSGGSKAKVSVPLYEIINIPDEVNVNQEFSSKIKINNDDSTIHSYKIWSYVYRGSKSYSGEREANLKKLTIPAKSSVTIKLKNKVSEGGDFKFKIKIRKDSQKTTKDITRDIKVNPLINENGLDILKLIEERIDINQLMSEEKKSTEKEGLYSGKDEETNKDITLEVYKEPTIVYLSSSFKARNSAKFFIILLLALISIITIWGKKEMF